MIYLVGEVNEQMYLDFAQRVAKRPREVNIVINSQGGSLSDALAIYDLVKSIPKSTITATGLCASAAMTVLQSAQSRRATPWTTFLMHEGQMMEDGKTKTDITKSDMRAKCHFDRLEFEIMEPKVGTKVYRESIDQEFFDSRRALKWKFIDKIVETVTSGFSKFR